MFGSRNNTNKLIILGLVIFRMGHSDISVTMNVYTHIEFDDGEEELKRIEAFR